MEIDTEEQDAPATDGELEAPVFSLHVVAGVPCCGTLQLSVTVGTASLIALLDSGSTHNIISAGAAARTGLPVESRPRLTAVAANGERVSCPGVLRAAPVIIADTSFNIDLFVMPLAGFDVVLGTQWLATLGPVVWDFAAPSMAFRLHGRAIHWTGVPIATSPQLHSTVAGAPLLAELLATFEDVFAEPTGLPPARGHDHRIILKPGAPPVAVRHTGIRRRTRTSWNANVPR